MNLYLTILNIWDWFLDLDLETQSNLAYFVLTPIVTGIVLWSRYNKKKKQKQALDELGEEDEDVWLMD